MDEHAPAVVEDRAGAFAMHRPVQLESRIRRVEVPNRRPNTVGTVLGKAASKIRHTGPVCLAVLHQRQDEIGTPGCDLHEVALDAGQGPERQTFGPGSSADRGEGVAQETSRMKRVISGRMFSRHFLPLKMP